MSERGPVGGAGELTAPKYMLHGHSICLTGTEWPPILRDRQCDLEFMALIVDLLNRNHKSKLAAKAPQGVPSRERLQAIPSDVDAIICRVLRGRVASTFGESVTDVRRRVAGYLERALTDTGDRPSSEGGGLAANPGYPAPESTGGPQKMADIADEINQCLQIIVSNAGNIQIGLGVSSERAKRVRSIEKAVERAARAVRGLALAAPPAPSLPVPGPVSDTTIHHGMFPPAPSGAISKLADEVNQCLQIILTNAGNIRDSRKMRESQIWARAIENAVERASKATWDALREAAAPKPAPARCPTCTSPAPHLHPAVQHEGEVQPCADAFHKQATSQNKLMGATPAPGAERLLKAGDEVWVRGKVTDSRPLSSGAIVVAMSDSSGDDDGVVFVRPEDVREALAAAPPAPSEHPQLGTHLQHCNFGEHENTCKYGDENCPALSEGWSWFGKALQNRDLIQSRAYNNGFDHGKVAAGHASAERVREEIANELSSPYKESIFTPLSDDELMRCVDVLTNSGVRAASDRLHASWARHWSKVLRSLALPPSTGEKQP